MRVTVRKDPTFSKIENLFILLAEGDHPTLNLPDPVRSAVRQLRKRSGFLGRKDEGVSLAADGGPKKITFVGLGKQDKLTVGVLKAAARGVGRIARRNHDHKIAVLIPYQLPDLEAAASTGLIAGILAHSDYRYDPYITVREDDDTTEIHCTLIPSDDLGGKELKRLVNESTVLSEAVKLVRDLGNAPGNEMTPTRLAQRAAEMAAGTGIKCTVFDKKQIEKQKMGGLLAVNRGSHEEPRFVILDYSPRKSSRTVCLVGKGITFDSGGISIKPADRMEEMKFDMCGAATVIGVLFAAAKLQLPIRVVGIFASTENLPGGSAYKPGDIITTMSGKTVEIVNTDAEGRMILSDALHYASRFKPDHLIDFATLTGACVVALGHEASGVFSNDDELARKLIEAGEKTGERLWRLPEWDEYKELIRSEWADVKNSGGRWGGAITAAVFLKEFVDCRSWAHIDIAGTAYTEQETARDSRGATGAVVRATVEFLQSLSR